MKNFSRSWKRSTQARKQRKYRYQAPLHLKQKLMHAHLSKELRTKYGRRSIQLRKGDKIKVMVGQFAKKEGKVEKINLKRERVFITGVEIIKKDGSKILFPLKASNLMILDLELSDKIRKAKLESKQQGNKTAATKAAPIKKIITAKEAKNVKIGERK